MIIVLDFWLLVLTFLYVFSYLHQPSPHHFVFRSLLHASPYPSNSLLRQFPNAVRVVSLPLSGRLFAFLALLILSFYISRKHRELIMVSTTRMPFVRRLYVRKTYRQFVLVHSSMFMTSAISANKKAKVPTSPISIKEGS